MRWGGLVQRPIWLCLWGMPGVAEQKEKVPGFSWWP